MISPRSTTLFFAPTAQYVEAQITALTPEMAEARIHHDWWIDSALVDPLHPPPIDRHWNWNQMRLEYESRSLTVEKVAIVTGDQAVQRAMMISADPMPSRMPGRGAKALFVELLFAAPRNRPALRRDGKPFFLGAGTELLTWGAWFSRQKGHEGGLLLDGSPEYVQWYQRRGLQKLDADPIVFEGVAYVPMELPAEAARRLLESWE